MDKKIKIFLFLMIIIVASLLRLWQIGNVPASPDWDEVSLGYNAYSIMQTGKDEYGQFLPIVLRSFDDYKPALYTYLVIPLIKIFDLNILAVRLPSAIFGILTVIATYFLVMELFRGKKNVDNFALASSFLLAISPWHIQFSRIAFESNVGLSFNIFLLLFFLKGLKNPKFLLLSFLLGSLNFYMYQSEKVFVPILFIVLIFIFRREFFKVSKKYIIASALISFVIVLPMVLSLFINQNSLMRAKGVSVFSDQTQFLKRNAQKINFDKVNGDNLGLLIDNRRVEYGKAIVNGYISHFDLNWLFVSGDIARHHAPGMGLMYLFELPFLLAGIYLLIWGNYDKKTKFAIIGYFLIVPIPASITSGVPHAVRTLNFLPILQIFTAIGLISFLSFLFKSKNIYKYTLLLFISLVFIFNLAYYLDQYFVQYNYYNSKDWQYGYKDAISYVKNVESNYNKIIVSNQPPLDQSYMFFLFYLKFDPQIYQRYSKDSSGGFRENHNFGKYEFRSIIWEKEVKSSDVLYVMRPQDVPIDINTLKTIYYLDNEPAIKIVK